MRRLIAALVLACAVPAFAPPARATITPDAAKVVHRYLEVSGGEQAFAAESTSYTHAKLYAFGFEGSFSSWSARPARRYSRTELGPVQALRGRERHHRVAHRSHDRRHPAARGSRPGPGARERVVRG
jgi:hypothetical protein